MELITLFFENFSSCDSTQPPPCLFWQKKSVVDSLILPHGILGFGFQCTDRPVRKQQRRGWLCLCRTGGDRCATSGSAVSMHECSRCSSQGRWESFRVTGERSLTPIKGGFSSGSVSAGGGSSYSML